MRFRSEAGAEDGILTLEDLHVTKHLNEALSREDEAKWRK